MIDLQTSWQVFMLVFHWILDDLHASINGEGRYLNDQKLMVATATHSGYARNAACGDEVTVYADE